ncbi:DUF2878 domain-containing protein [bacterium]|nr:DUF2878 domain-containing protein [bacterium]
MRDTLVNASLYQAGWFAMVLGAARGWPRAGAGVGLVLLVVHLVLARERKPELLTVLAVGVLGTIVDSAQAFAGVFVFESGYWSYWVVPFWLTVMWMQFATLFHFALRWLSGRYLLSAVLGAVGGPAAFWTGERLGGVVFPMGTWHSLLILAAVWFVVMPLSILLADRFRPQKGIGQYRI